MSQELLDPGAERAVAAAGAREKRGALGGSRFLLRRVPFPQEPPAEWFVVDLIENRDRAGVSLDQIEEKLSEALADDRFDPERLEDMAFEFGTRLTQSLVERAAAEVIV